MKKTTGLKFEYYINLAGMWRWHLLLNGKIAGTSNGEYKTKQECLKDIEDIKFTALEPTTEITVFDMMSRPRRSFLN